MCLFRLFFYEKYDWSNHSMIKCKFKKVNNWTTTTYAPMGGFWLHNQWGNKQRVLMHGHLGWNVRNGLCHIYMKYVYTWVVYSFCLFCCLFIIVTCWYVWCIEWASGNQEEVQTCLVTLWLLTISYYSLYKTTLGLLCSCFENNPYFHIYSTDFHV